jgi:purine-binding chemotaxis protein CheW
MTSVTDRPGGPRTDEGSVASEPQSDAVVQLVVCAVAGERYGLPVERVHEIVRSIAVTPLPGADQAFSGVINLRGRIIPVMDLRRRLGLTDAPATRLSRIVVAEAAGVQVGIVVDAVYEVLRIPAASIEPAPVLAASAATDHVTGIARSSDGLIIVLALEGLVATPAPAGTDDSGPEARPSRPRDRRRT